MLGGGGGVILGYIMPNVSHILHENIAQHCRMIKFFREKGHCYEEHTTQDNLSNKTIASMPQIYVQ